MEVKLGLTEILRCGSSMGHSAVRLNSISSLFATIRGFRRVEIVNRLAQIDQVVAQTSQKRVAIDHPVFLDHGVTLCQSDHGFGHGLHFVDRREHLLLGFRIIDELCPQSKRRRGELRS